MILCPVENWSVSSFDKGIIREPSSIISSVSSSVSISDSSTYDQPIELTPMSKPTIFLM